DQVELALQLILRHVCAATQEYLLYIGLGGARSPSDGVGAHGSIPPAQNRQTLFFRDALDDAFADKPLLRFHRQEHHSHAVSSGLGERKPQSRAFAGKKLVRNLDRDARAIAGFRIAAASPAMRQIDQDLNAFAYDLMGLFAIEVDDKAHSAGIMLKLGVV